MSAIDAEQLRRLVHTAANDQKPEVSAWIVSRLEAGDVTVFDPPDSEWLTVTVGGVRLARIHRSRLNR